MHSGRRQVFDSMGPNFGIRALLCFKALAFFLILLFLVMEPNSVRVYKRINLHTMPCMRAVEHEVIHIGKRFILESPSFGPFT